MGSTVDSEDYVDALGPSWAGSFMFPKIKAVSWISSTEDGSASWSYYILKVLTSHVGFLGVACSSMFSKNATDYGLTVANGTYFITATNHNVLCSLYCTPAFVAASCSSMQCSNSNLIIGNFTSQQTSAGCSVTSCDYSGFVNGSIITALTTSIEPQCPGMHQLPPVISPPTALEHGSFFSPSPSPVAESGGTITNPRSSMPGTFSLPGISPASGPSGSFSDAIVIRPLCHNLDMLAYSLFVFSLLSSVYGI
ncbi:hypothetical protein ZIOFF_068128 [Zingiber officinale]|uniref:Uncharacterized protein n=1 Tax=Zingiber officinale TaxID=94328 RepID=A0A8J5CF07_ZINOF|nr:hypothetical protein ZIOFF_068128 [Zingiber officinale]